MVDGDWYVEAVGEVERSAAAAHAAIDEYVALLRRSLERRRAEVTMAEIVGELLGHGARDARIGASEALARYETAVSSFRGNVVRALVDDDGMSFTEVGRRLGISRQMASRLYRQTPPLR